MSFWNKFLHVLRHRESENANPLGEQMKLRLLKVIHKFEGKSFRSYGIPIAYIIIEFHSVDGVWLNLLTPWFQYTKYPFGVSLWHLYEISACR